MRALIALAASMIAAGCVPLAAESKGDRIVSLDLCADQMVTGLVPPERIAAVSTEANMDAAVIEAVSADTPRIRADAERVIAMRPTLVVRSYSGGPRFDRAMEKAGIPVITLPYADTIAATRKAIVDAGQKVGEPKAAAARLAQFDDDLGAPTTQYPALSALYLTPGNVTTGRGSLIEEMMRQAGFTSYEQRAGWHSIPLERIAQDRPDAIVRGFFDRAAFRQDRWSTSDHQIIKARIDGVPSIAVRGSDLSCANWRVGQTVAALRRFRASIK